MKLMSESWGKYIGLIVIYGCISIMLFSYMSSNILVPTILDIINHLLGITQAKLALQEGQFVLRVMPLVHDGWRYPFFQFYSPSSYQIAALICLLLTPSNAFIAYKITIWLGFTVGGIYMYRLAYEFVKSESVAILSGVIYLTAPYVAITITYMAAFNESIALGILPAVIYYTFKQYTTKNSHMILLQTAIMWYLLATIHLLTFLYSSLFVAILLILVTVKSPKQQWRNLIAVGVAYTFGLFLAMWYLAPLIELGKYLEINRTFGNSAAFMSSTPHLSDLFFPFIKVYGTHQENVHFDTVASLHPSIRLPIIISVGIAIYACLNKLTIAEKRADFWLGPLTIAFLIAFILVWSPINFWQWLPKSLMVVQYSWRILGQLMWMGALISAWALCWLFRNNLDVRHVIIGTAILILATCVSIPIPGLNYLPFQDEINKPLLTVNPHAYLIEPRINSKIANAMDSVLLESFKAGDGIDSWLILNKPVTLSSSMLSRSKSLILNIQGYFPNEKELQSWRYTVFFPNERELKNWRLIALINGKVYSSHTLKAGNFNWSIPISDYKNKDASITFFIEDIKTGKKIENDVRLPLNIMLSGYLQASTYMDVHNTQSHCTQLNTDTVCSLYVPKGIELLELPIYYYPGMLDVTLNGKPVDYSNVMYKSYLLVGIKPLAGEINHIQFKFRGLLWANYLSATAFQLWLILFVYVLLKNRNHA